MNKHEVGLVALLKTKVKKENIALVASRLFVGWEWLTNVDYNPKVHIWVAWNSRAYQVIVMEALEQMVHCRAC